MSLCVMGTSAPVLLDTSTLFTHSQPCTASSTILFRGMIFPPRTPSSAVTTTHAEAENEKKSHYCDEWHVHLYMQSHIIHVYKCTCTCIIIIPTSKNIGYKYYTCILRVSVPSLILFLNDSALNPANTTLRTDTVLYACMMYI